jgi:gamma-glutamyltranspeptidase / glutathione hydrolase
LNFDYHYQPYASNRYTAMAKNGMVATSQQLASQAGLEMLKKGGNAVDAAIATAACLTVVEPTSNGIGGDAFALVWIEEEQKLYGLNGSGYAPAAMTADAIRSRGFDKMPLFGWETVTIPGAPAAWAALSKRFGKLTFAELMAPAVRYARDGFPATPVVADYWQTAYLRLKAHCKPEVLAEWHRTFMPEGKAPQAGDLVVFPHHAETLAEIGATDAESFYRGDLAVRIAACSERNLGFIQAEDLAGYQVEWVDPISVNYRGYDICEIPPNGQGLVALLALNILKGFEFTHREDPHTYHTQFEAMKLAFADGKKYITDPRYMPYTPQQLLDEAYAQERRQMIQAEAQDFQAGKPDSSGTVYLCSADADGNMVSFIQSNYLSFGSGAVVDGTGIALQNRGADFSLSPQDHNYLEPGKRTYHTIIPGFILKDKKAVGPFGVMGAYMQPQGHVQVVMNMIDFDLNPQMALDAPRWQWTAGKKFSVEPAFPFHTFGELQRRGHTMSYEPMTLLFGKGQIIIRKNGVYFGGTESRSDGAISCY